MFVRRLRHPLAPVRNYAPMPTSPDDELIPAALHAREFQKLTGNPGPGLRKELQLAADGLLPLEHRRGRWFVRRSKLPQLATALGLTVEPSDDLQAA